MNWDYDRACAALDEVVDLEKTPLAAGMPPPTLERMAQLMAAVGSPQSRYQIIHITGTNGKTSVGQMAASVLGAAGFKVGLYSSPHLDRVNERMVRDGRPISDHEFARNVGAIIDQARHMANAPNYFELTTAAAFLWFAEAGVDIAVIEVGLLGRWDATNIADGDVAVVTSVGADHIDYAGSLENVAKEKAGIIKPGSTLVLGEVSNEFDSIFNEAPSAATLRQDKDYTGVTTKLVPAGRRADFRTPKGTYHDVMLSQHGGHQVGNAACALTAAEAISGHPFPDELVRRVLGSLLSPGRMEVIHQSPVCMLDGAHNPPAVAALARALQEEFALHKWIVIYGALSGHDYERSLEALIAAGGVAAVVTCEPRNPRAIPASDLAEAAARRGVPAQAEPAVRAAVARALRLASDGSSILVTGSFYHLADARRAVEDLTGRAPGLTILLCPGAGHASVAHTMSSQGQRTMSCRPVMSI
jgi:dihydrofolate synthase/folylpolyglutamate synthase